MPQSQRELQLINWKKAPFARYCHPREEHLIPLYFCAGLAEKPGQLLWDGKIMGIHSVAFSWP